MTDYQYSDSIAAWQSYIHAWASRTFPNRPPKASLSKLVMEEIPELLQHLKEKGSVDIGHELADCFILLLDLAAIWNVDISTAIGEKMAINERRTWDRDPDTGFYNHTREGI